MEGGDDMKKVLLRGPVLTQSGYGVHARQIASWLFSRNDLDVEVQALPWGDTPWIIDKDTNSGLIGKLMERSVDPSGRVYDVSVQLQLPNEWDASLARANIGITAGVETDRCNPAWIDSCNRMTTVIVPSKHTESSLRASGKLDVPLKVIPEAFSEAYLKDVKSSIDDLELSTSFNFLMVGQITGNNPENDRKNIFYAVKWFCEAFKDDQSVGLVIKTNSGRNTTIDRKIVTQTFENLIREVRKSQFPRIHLVHGEMTDEEMCSLYKHPKIKGFLTLTRGEGYGLPILEAAASGLPILATGWSGHTDFLSHGNYISFSYKLSPIHQSRVDNKIFVPGSNWAHPIEEDFKKKILKFKSAPSIPKEWAESLKKKILENYSLEKITSMYNESLKEIV